MKKITRATIKSFIKREHKNKNLFIKTTSRFDGMVDCVTPTSESFKQAESYDFMKDNTLGIEGLWLVGRSNDYFEPYADDDYIGYKILNSCGSSIIAMSRLA